MWLESQGLSMEPNSIFTGGANFDAYFVSPCEFTNHVYTKTTFCHTGPAQKWMWKSGVNGSMQHCLWEAKREVTSALR